MNKWLLLTASLIIMVLHVEAQTEIKSPKLPFVLGVVDQVYSPRLSETRMLNIYLPEDYDADTLSYPVIYLLDGSSNEDFIHIVGVVQFLTMIEAMPKSIVVR